MEATSKEFKQFFTENRIEWRYFCRIYSTSKLIDYFLPINNKDPNSTLLKMLLTVVVLVYIVNISCVDYNLVGTPPTIV